MTPKEGNNETKVKKKKRVLEVGSSRSSGELALAVSLQGSNNLHTHTQHQQLP